MLLSELGLDAKKARELQGLPVEQILTNGLFLWVFVLLWISYRHWRAASLHAPTRHSPSIPEQSRGPPLVQLPAPSHAALDQDGRLHQFAGQRLFHQRLLPSNTGQPVVIGERE